MKVDRPYHSKPHGPGNQILRKAKVFHPGWTEILELRAPASIYRWGGGSIRRETYSDPAQAVNVFEVALAAGAQEIALEPERQDRPKIRRGISK